MKISKFLLKLFIALCLFGKASTKELAETKIAKNAPAAWTMLVYMDADNSLASYASYNMNEMSTGLTSLNGINVLVQWNKPRVKETWRCKIIPGGNVDAGSFSTEMGYNPSIELVKSMQWIVKNYPANNYALILWNHGSGVEDFYPDVAQKNISRGILYDDEEQTCLTNQGLLSALTQIKQLLGKNIDLIAMDACLMAMVEVSYQMKNLVNIFVGSQETIPGNGFAYSQFIKPLSINPAGTTPLQLAQDMVSAYKNFYTTLAPTPDFTLSAIDITSIDLIKQNIDQFITAVAACSQADAASTKNVILAARKASISFEMPEYIDLYSFYANILNQIKNRPPKSALILGKQKKTTPAPSKNYQDTLNILNSVIQDGLNKITKVVLQEAAGAVYAGAKGISIYYPSSGLIDPTYPLTIFAQNTSWMQFIQTYH
jgi:hypothetical protein